MIFYKFDLIKCLFFISICFDGSEYDWNTAASGPIVVIKPKSLDIIAVFYKGPDIMIKNIKAFFFKILKGKAYEVSQTIILEIVFYTALKHIKNVLLNGGIVYSLQVDTISKKCL